MRFLGRAGASRYSRSAVSQSSARRLRDAEEIVRRLMPALQEIQEFYGYIPEPTVHLTAERLNIYASQIYGVLTFYAQFHLEPRGKYIIRVCMGTACYVKGAGEIVEASSAQPAPSIHTAESPASVMEELEAETMEPAS